MYSSDTSIDSQIGYNYLYVLSNLMALSLASIYISNNNSYILMELPFYAELNGLCLNFVY